jgi:hypothetical protein
MAPSRVKGFVSRKKQNDSNPHLEKMRWNVAASKCWNQDTDRMQIILVIRLAAAAKSTRPACANLLIAGLRFNAFVTERADNGL